VVAATSRERRGPAAGGTGERGGRGYRSRALRAGVLYPARGGDGGDTRAGDRARHSARRLGSPNPTQWADLDADHWSDARRAGERLLPASIDHQPARRGYRGRAGAAGDDALPSRPRARPGDRIARGWTECAS